MLVEVITFRLSVELLVFLKKNGLISSEIFVDFFDREKHQFVTFSSLEEMQSYFDTAYKNYDKCQLGNIVSLQKVKFTSNLYNYKTNYNVFDIKGATKISAGKDYDIERDSQRKKFNDRQVKRIESAINTYKRLFFEIQTLYLNGVYSPCYAEPGWSEGTSRLEELRVQFTIKKNSGVFA